MRRRGADVDRDRDKEWKSPLDIIFYLCIFVGGPAVAVAEQSIGPDKLPFGEKFIFHALGAMILILGVPFLVTLLAKERDSKRMTWAILSALSIYGSLR